MNLNLLGLNVSLDNCSNGPVTVAIAAHRGRATCSATCSAGWPTCSTPTRAPLALLQQIGRIAGSTGSCDGRLPDLLNRLNAEGPAAWPGPVCFPSNLVGDCPNGFNKSL